MNQTSSDYILSGSRDYAIYVAENRAIPSIADGLKHVQRMALWTLKDRAEKLKVIALSGLLSYSRLYVHGDSSSNNAISLLAAPYCNNIPLITGYGSFGSRIAPVEGIGAARYVAVSRSTAAQAFLYNDTDLVPLEGNYDGSNQQPKHFLPLIPTVLLNGVTGIAVGWSTNILPHDLTALIKATKAALLGHETAALVPSYAHYDVTVSPLGPNQWLLSGKVKIIDTSTVQITELPPGLAIETFRRRLIAMEEAEQIVRYTDRSTDRIDIVVKMKRGSLHNWDADTVIEFFKLREKITERIVVIGWNGKSITTYASPDAVVRDFTAWRLTWYTKRFEKFCQDSRYELIYWLMLDALFVAKFPARLGKFADRTELQTAIMKIAKQKKIDLDDHQLGQIVNLPTHRWTQQFAIEVVEKIATLRGNIQEYETILASPDRLRQVYLDELDRLLKSEKLFR